MILDLRLLHEKEAEILFDFIDICEEYSLTYYLAYGTLLGAKRHEGFIPWDDDIDVEMPRRDYERFCREYYKKLPERLVFKSFDKDDEYLSYVPRIEDQSVTVTDAYGAKSFVWIDIFPIDGFPRKNNFTAKLYKLALCWKRFIINLSRMDKGLVMQSANKSKIYNLCVGVIAKINPGKMIDCRKQLYKLDKIMTKYDPFATKSSMVFMGEKFKDVCPIDYYGSGRKLMFEGRQINVPEKTEELLTQIYGDYMQLPPEEQRNVHNTVSIKLCDEE